MCQPCMMVRKEIEDREKNKALDELASRFADWDKYDPNHNIHYGRAGKLVWGCGECEIEDQKNIPLQVDEIAYLEELVDRIAQRNGN